VKSNTWSSTKIYTNEWDKETWNPVSSVFLHTLHSEYMHTYS